MYWQETLDGGLASFEEARQASERSWSEAGNPACRLFWSFTPDHKAAGSEECDHKSLPPPTDHRYRRSKPLTKLKLQQP